MKWIGKRMIKKLHKHAEHFTLMQCFASKREISMSQSVLEQKMNQIMINLIQPAEAKEICRSLTATLPEWFGVAAANARYEEGMLNRTSFAATIDNVTMGMITLEFTYPHNAHIYWMGVHKNYHNQKIGSKLLNVAQNYCLEKGFATLTVETLSPKNKDANYLKTYSFYEKSGFSPLFEMHTYGPHYLMVYMQKRISLDDYIFIDLTHSLSSEVPHWGLDVGFKYNARLIQSTDSASNVTFRVQRLEMTSGIGTHMDAPSHCFEKGPAINQLPLQSLITTCRVIDVSSKAHEHYKVSEEDIREFEVNYGVIPKNAFVIIHTGWDERWKQPERYRNEKVFPSISIEAAQLLLSRNIVGVGIDTLSPDAFGSDFPVHQCLLGAGKYIVENVANAKLLDPTGCTVFALPIKVIDGTEAPIRLVGMKKKDV